MMVAFLRMSPTLIVSTVGMPTFTRPMIVYLPFRLGLLSFMM